ncbi:MAG TPA: zinc-binding dehydrogenase [Chloroflexota bacterium]|nr:zinc-binding dehydrogenase [Chloroflexota bacterium]
MQAFVMRALDEVGFVEKALPLPGPYDAVVQTTRALISTSDTHTVHGGIGPRRDLTLGEEAVGVVYQVGSEVQDFRPGDRVVVGAVTPDWLSEEAQAGHGSQSTRALGGWKYANTRDGVFAEYFLVNQADANMALVPETVADEAAVYCSATMSTGFLGAENAGIVVGGSVAIFGQGPIGLMATAGARLRGAGLIIAVESVAKRKDLALHYGADVVVDYTSIDPVQAILDLTGGKGVDAAIEALGADVTLQNAIKVTRPGGTISNIGYHGHGEYLHIPRVEWGVGMAEKTIKTGLCPGGRLRLERLLRLLENGRVDPTRMTTHTYLFSQLDDAFTLMDKKLDGVIKPLIVF